MRAMRDILSIVGSIGIGWFIFCWARYSERGMVEGLIATVISLFISICSIRADSREKNRLLSEKAALDLENTYLRTAIKQGART